MINIKVLNLKDHLKPSLQKVKHSGPPAKASASLIVINNLMIGI